MKENKESVRILMNVFILNLELSNLIDYSTDMCFSCACTTRYIELKNIHLSVFVCGECF